jgi:hypothetical protein
LIHATQIQESFISKTLQQTLATKNYTKQRVVIYIAWTEQIVKLADDEQLKKQQELLSADEFCNS